MAALVVCFALGLSVSVVQKLQVGVQAGFVAGLWQGLGAVLGLCALLAGVWLSAGLPFLVIAVAGNPLLAAALNAAVFFRQAPEYRPTLRDVDLDSLRTLSRTGALFLMLQLSSALAFGSDAFIVAHLMGSVAVPQYAVPARLFSVVPLILWFCHRSPVAGICGGASAGRQSVG